MGAHLQQADLPIVGIEDFERVRADRDAFIALWNTTKVTEHEAANGVEILFRKLAVEIIIEFLAK